MAVSQSYKQQLALQGNIIMKSYKPEQPENDASLYLSFLTSLAMNKKTKHLPYCTKACNLKKCFNCLQEVKNLDNRSKCLCFRVRACMHVCVCVYVYFL